MNKARIDNGIVAEILVQVPGFAFEECFPAEILGQCVDCDDGVAPGMRYAGGTFLEAGESDAIRNRIAGLEAGISERMWREAALGSSALMAFGAGDPRTGKTATQYIAWVDEQIAALREQIGC